MTWVALLVYLGPKGNQRTQTEFRDRRSGEGKRKECSFRGTRWRPQDPESRNQKYVEDWVALLV